MNSVCSDDHNNNICTPYATLNNERSAYRILITFIKCILDKHNQGIHRPSFIEIMTQNFVQLYLQNRRHFWGQQSSNARADHAIRRLLENCVYCLHRKRQTCRHITWARKYGHSSQIANHDCGLVIYLSGNATSRPTTFMYRQIRVQQNCWYEDTNNETRESNTKKT